MINIEYKFNWKDYNKAIRLYCLENDLQYTKFLKGYQIHPESMNYQINKKYRTISDQIIKKVKNIKEVDYKKFMWDIVKKYEIIDLPENAKEYMSKSMVWYYKNKKSWKIRAYVWKRYLLNKENKWQQK